MRRTLRSRRRTIVDSLTTVAILIAVGFVIYRNWPPPVKKHEIAIPADPLSIPEGTVVGDRRASAGLLVFTDFQCPFCKGFATEVLPMLQREYVSTGKIFVAIRQFPIKQLHPFAYRSAEAALCAERQGQFFPFHDRLFLDQKNLGEDKLEDIGRDVGLDLQRFRACLAGQAATQVEADLETGRALGISGTPSFLFGRQTSDGRLKIVATLAGGASLPDWRKEIDRTIDPSTSVRVYLGLAGALALILVGWRLLRKRTGSRPGVAP